MKDYTFTSDLVADDIRCKIKNINKEGQETFITVWNIKGDRRVQVLQELQELTQIVEDDADLFDKFYTGLILEFTDLVLDTDDILFMINDGSLVSRMLMQEFNDMLYEIQYEIAMNQLQETRNLAIAMIQQSALDEMKYAQERIEKTKERRDKHVIRENKRKVNRRMVDKNIVRNRRGRRK